MVALSIMHTCHTCCTDAGHVKCNVFISGQVFLLEYITMCMVVSVAMLLAVLNVTHMVAHGK